MSVELSVGYDRGSYPVPGGRKWYADITTTDLDSGLGGSSIVDVQSIVIPDCVHVDEGFVWKMLIANHLREKAERYRDVQVSSVYVPDLGYVGVGV